MHQPKSKHYKVLQGVMAGKSKVQSCIDAGYGNKYAENKSGAIVAAALAALPGDAPTRQSIGTKALWRLDELLTTMPEDRRLWPPILRLALEYAQEMSPSSLHLHQHNYSPETLKALDQYKDFLALKGTTIDAASISEGPTGQN